MAMATLQVRWGLLGTARINRRFIPAARAAARSVITAVASRDAARAGAFARAWAIPHAAGSYADLLARDDVDAVYVPLPNRFPVEWTHRAIDARKHVLCEKPLAADPAEVARIAVAAAACGVHVAEAIMYRHESLTARVAALLADGAIGALRTIASGFTYQQSRPDDVRLDASLGGGALWDVGCYPVSYACLLTRRDAVWAAASARMTAGGVDEETTGLLRFPGDITAAVYAGFRASYHTWLEVVGSEGWLRAPHPFKPGPRETIVLERLGRRMEVEVAATAPPYVRQVEDFVATVLDGAPAVVPLEDSRRVAAALAALAAARRQEGPG